MENGGDFPCFLKYGQRTTHEMVIGAVDHSLTKKRKVQAERREREKGNCSSAESQLTSEDGVVRNGNEILDILWQPPRSAPTPMSKLISVTCRCFLTEVCEATFRGPLGKALRDGGRLPDFNLSLGWSNALKIIPDSRIHELTMRSSLEDMLVQMQYPSVSHSL